MRKKTKIIATIGPNSAETETLKKMIRAGVDGIRINTAHGEFEDYERYIKLVRGIKELPIILDLKGPEVRIRVKEEIKVKPGTLVEVGFSDKQDNYFSYDFSKEVKTDSIVLIDDGKIITKLVKKRKDFVVLKSFSEGVIKSRKGVNIPNSKLKVPSLSNKDLEAIEWSKKNKIEFLALSFTRSKEDVLRVKSLVKGTGIDLIAKIENCEGLQNIDEIIEVSDGVMVARGDLGVELRTEKIPMIQKELIGKCNKAGVISITATQMLESMIENKQPTRAETSDVANAILDGTDTVMLSGETAVGKYPVEAIKVMTKVALETEPFVKSIVKIEKARNISDAISETIPELVSSLGIDKVITLTRSGYTARMVSRFKIQKPIIGVTKSEITRKQLELVYGVIPVYLKEIPESNKVIYITEELLKLNELSRDDLVIFTAGAHTSQKFSSNMIEIHNISNLIEYCDEHKKMCKSLHACK